MGVDYTAGIGYGIRISGDELYDKLKEYYDIIDSLDKLPSCWSMTEEEFTEWKEEYDFNSMKELLHDDGVMINTNSYSESDDHIIGFSIRTVEWGCINIDLNSIKELSCYSEKIEKINKWKKILNITDNPSFVLYCRTW